MHRKTSLLLLGISLGIVLSIAVFNLYAQEEYSSNVTTDENGAGNEPVSIRYDACAAQTGSDRALDVLVFVDVSDQANLADAGMRKEILHLLIDFLFVDNRLRGVDNRFAVWVYSDETRSVGNLNIQSTEILGANKLKNLHHMIDSLKFSQDESYRVDFNDLVKTITEETIDNLDRDYNRVPVIILLNDMYPNESSSENEAAQLAHEAWWSQDRETLLAEKGYFYVLDFSSTYYVVPDIGVEEVKETWLNTFFDNPEKPVLGGYRTITAENELLEISRIIEETTTTNFDFLTAAPTQLTLCPFTQEIRFALLFEDSNTSDLPRSNLLPDTSRMIEEGHFGIVASITPSSEFINLFPNNRGQDQDILYAYHAVGGLHRSVCPPEIIPSGGVLAIQWPSEINLRSAGLTIRYHKLNSEEYNLIEPQPNTSHLQIIDESLPNVIEDTEYELEIVNGLERLPCNFTIVPIPELTSIELSELRVNQPFTATLMFSHANKIEDWSRLKATLQSFDRQGGNQEFLAEFIDVDAASGQVTYVVPSGQIEETPLEWAFNIELLTKTVDGIDVTIRENRRYTTDLPSDWKSPEIYVSIHLTTTEVITDPVVVTGTVTSANSPDYHVISIGEITTTANVPITYAAQISQADEPAPPDISVERTVSIALWAIFIVWALGMIFSVPVYQLIRKTAAQDNQNQEAQCIHETQTFPRMRVYRFWLQVFFLLYTLGAILSGFWVFSLQYGTESVKYFYNSLFLVDILLLLGIICTLFLRLKYTQSVDIVSFIVQIVLGVVSFGNQLVLKNALTVNDLTYLIENEPRQWICYLGVVLLILWIILLAGTILWDKWLKLQDFIDKIKKLWDHLNNLLNNLGTGE